ncbi:MAG: hypothetical protein IOB85_14930 [Methylobacterium sp.]|nr:hypothetical protein [Rhodobacter sp.]MCA3655365.1 hypothetical protein [Methylobacterium sp.]MCA3659183.1 hypothetical protein [Methylobacterium sp.]MCA3672356.1 hypothetical protein [Methylobacterium sp.]MCA3678365.1 hypothetical protein [Methylobacterium sp.]
MDDLDPINSDAPCVPHQLTELQRRGRKIEFAPDEGSQTARREHNPGISLSRVKPNPCHHRRPLAPAKAFRRMDERFRGDEVFFPRRPIDADALRQPQQRRNDKGERTRNPAGRLAPLRRAPGKPGAVQIDASPYSGITAPISAS